MHNLVYQNNIKQSISWKVETMEVLGKLQFTLLAPSQVILLAAGLTRSFDLLTVDNLSFDNIK